LPGNKPESKTLEFVCEWQCGICIAVCRDRAVSYRPGGIEIDRAACSGCMLCVKICPAGIIREDRFD
jgi:Fe-S-cluster-containing hydrogenase component 2